MGPSLEVPASSCPPACVPWRESPHPALGGEHRPPLVGWQGGVPAAHPAVLGRCCSRAVGGSRATSPRPLLCPQGPPGQPGAKVSARRVSDAPPPPPCPAGVTGECAELTEAGAPVTRPSQTLLLGASGRLPETAWGGALSFTRPCLLTGEERGLWGGTPQPLRRQMVPETLGAPLGAPHLSSLRALAPTCPWRTRTPPRGAEPVALCPWPRHPAQVAPAHAALVLRMSCFALQSGDLSKVEFLEGHASFSSLKL